MSKPHKITKNAHRLAVMKSAADFGTAGEDPAADTLFQKAIVALRGVFGKSDVVKEMVQL